MLRGIIFDRDGEGLGGLGDFSFCGADLFGMDGLEEEADAWEGVSIFGAGFLKFLLIRWCHGVEVGGLYHCS